LRSAPVTAGDEEADRVSMRRLRVLASRWFGWPHLASVVGTTTDEIDGMWKSTWADGSSAAAGFLVVRRNVR
jgi:hypothetical protein